MHISGDSKSMVIIGAGHCGGRAALALREHGWQGAITLIGDEYYPPYERPALSKALLAGDVVFEALHLTTTQGWQDAGIDLKLGTAVSHVDRGEQVVVLEDGSIYPYGRLLIATGGAARRLPFLNGDSSRVHSIRTYEDVRQLQPLLIPGKRVLLVGGGFIGLEVACTARTLGCEVVLVEGANRLLGRAVPVEIAERITHLHWARGVELSLGCLPESIQEDGKGVQVMLQNGQCYEADLVVVGIGMQPRTELASAAGLAVDLGIMVDQHLRTTDPLIFAAGDVCQFPSWLTQKAGRQETWHNAQAQAQVAAANMLGQAIEYHEPPWFWSDQYDHTLQVCGDPTLGVHITVRATGGEGVIQFYSDAGGRLVGFSGFGRQDLISRDLKIARKLVERGGVVDLASLANSQCPLKKLLSA